MTPLEQFRAAIQAAGYPPPDSLMADGRIHRFSANGKRSDDAGWYVFYPDGVASGAFGDWRTGIQSTFRADIGRPLTGEEVAINLQRMREAQAEREALIARQREVAAESAVSRWQAAKPANGHAYLRAKGVRGTDIREHNGELLIPIKDDSGAIINLQRILPDGTKLFLKGGKVGGGHYMIGAPVNGRLLVCEGYATGATLNQATGLPVAVAFNAGNLEPVARAMRHAFPRARITIAADNDAWTDGNPGLANSKRAAEAVGGDVVVPVFSDVSSRPTDFNDMARIGGIDAVRALVAGAATTSAPLRPITAAAFRLRDPSTIEPRDWLYKRIFIRGYVTGTFAPGAAAKTQMSLFDMVTMACGFDLATREPLRRGPLTVWYINVEDDREEIERRLAAICLHYRITDAELAGRLLVDTDREGRYLVAETTRHGVVVQEVVVSAILEQVKAHKVDLVVVDPLVGMHAVSENSNPEMNRVIAQLRRVAEQGNCGVHVVHHVRKGGDGEEVSAEDGRGASAIKDACRAIRTITPMSEKEAADFGISPERRRFYIWCNPSGKPNLAPPIAAREWFMLEDVGLGNGRADRDEDRIGVPVKWSPPSAFDGISLEDCRRIWVVVASISAPLTEARANAQSPAWLGWRVLKTLGWATSDIQSVSQIKRLLSSWLMGSVLEEYRVSDGQKGRDVPCLRLGPAAKLD